MQIFEFYFQAKISEDKVIKSSFFEPKTIYEKKLGSLYFLGKKNSHTEGSSLEEIFTVFRQKFYKKPSLSLQKAFEEAIKEINFYLRDKMGKSFFPDLSLLFFAIKDKKFALAKLGKIEVQLVRGGKVFNLSKRWKKGENFRSALKVIFGGVFSDDLIAIETEEVFEFFERTKVFEHLKKMYPFSPVEFKEILEFKKESFNKLGLCTLFFFPRGAEISSQEKFSLKKEVKIEAKKGRDFVLKSFEKKEVKLILAFIFFLVLSFILTKILG
jgi:hypothetical protein